MTDIQLMTMGKKLSNVYAELCAPVCREFEINQTCFDIMLFIANNPCYNTARDICELRGIKSSLASVAIDTLVKKGFLTCNDDSYDRRKRRLNLTPAADGPVEKGRERQSFFAEMLKSGVTQQELLTFKKVLGKIQNNIASFK